MSKKVEVKIKIDAQDYEWLERLAKKLRLTVGGLLEQELNEKLIDVEIWRQRFDILNA